MTYTLHGYQQTAANFTLERLLVQDEKGAGLFLDPGLGKTLITLDVMTHLLELGVVSRVLVIAPKRVCHMVWPVEIEKWGFDLVPYLLCGEVGKKGWDRKHGDVEIINPESIHHLLGHEGRWDLLVVDESTKFKNWSGSRSKKKTTTKRKVQRRGSRMPTLRKMLPHIPKRIILTGTPTAHSLGDLHAQVFILDDGEALGKNVTVFRSLYMQQGGYLGRQWGMRPEMERQLMEKVSPLCLRMDAESHLDMPPLVVNDIMVELPPDSRREYARLKRELLAELETGDILAMNAASAYAKMRQVASGAVYDDKKKVHRAHDEKLDALDDLLEELQGKNVLCFYQFAHEAERIRKRHPKAGVVFGGTKGKDAKELFDRWNKGDLPLLAIQTASASHGLNLQAGGNDVVYFALGDSYEQYDQSFRRVYRQGVKGTVRIHRILARDTVDEVIRQRLESKGTTQTEFLEALKAHAKS